MRLPCFNLSSVSCKRQKPSCSRSTFRQRIWWKRHIRMKSSKLRCICEQRRVCVKRGNMSVMSLADSNLFSTCPPLRLPACFCSQMCLLCQLSLYTRAHIKSSKEASSAQRKNLQMHA